jgi:hypothetical protein
MVLQDDDDEAADPDAPLASDKAADTASRELLVLRELIKTMAGLEFVQVRLPTGWLALCIITEVYMQDVTADQIAACGGPDSLRIQFTQPGFAHGPAPGGVVPCKCNSTLFIS